MPRSKSKRRRYQPPPRKKPKPSPRWYGALILVMLGIGVLIILAYYGLIPLTGSPGQHPYRLWLGLGLIALGFGAATRWR